MKTVILGSGATSGTLAGCPTTPGFGSALLARLAARGEDWRSEYPALARAIADLRPEQAAFGPAWDLADVWTRIDYFSKFPALRVAGDYTAEASYEIRRALLEVYGGFLCDEVTELLKSGRAISLLDIVSELQPGDVLVSFNWDVVVELVATHIHVSLAQAPHEAKVPSVKLVKPHGSVSWRDRAVNVGKPCCGKPTKQRQIEVGGPAPCTQPMRPDEVTEECQPFVVGAVPIKSELIQELQGHHSGSPYSVLMEQWKEFMAALRNADEVVVAGYALPDDDTYGRFLIQEAIAQRGTHALRRLYFYDLEDKRTSTASKLDRIFKPNIPPMWRGPVA